jgi:ATP-dependent Clp protease adaptor protein ClpS
LTPCGAQGEIPGKAKSVGWCRSEELQQGGGARMSEEHHPDFGEDLESRVEEDLEEPPMYRVLLHNDDYTTMEFVVEILQMVFHKSPAEATRIMLMVHKSGVGLCGVFTVEIAETKVELVHHLAKKHGFPLQCSMEEA